MSLSPLQPALYTVLLEGGGNPSLCLFLFPVCFFSCCDSWGLLWRTLLLFIYWSVVRKGESDEGGLGGGPVFSLDKRSIEDLKTL